MQADRRTALGVALALAALLATAPSPSAAVSLVGAAESSADPTGPLVAVLALLAWACAGWLACTVVLVALSRLQGLPGRSARALARLVAPAAVRRTVEVALGLTVAVGTLAPTAALATAPVPTPAQRATVDAEPAWDLDWPRTTADPTVAPPPTSALPSDAGSVDTAPSPGRKPAAPVTTAPTTAPVTTAPATAPATDPPAAPPPVRPAVVPPPAATPTVVPAATVVVRPGDTLWSLAEDALRDATAREPSDRQVALAWPRWWAANRDVVGDDPDLLHPGTVLHAPAAPPAQR